MNRRAFFKSLLSAAACVVARAYAPGAVAAAPLMRCTFSWSEEIGVSQLEPCTFLVRFDSDDLPAGIKRGVSYHATVTA